MPPINRLLTLNRAAIAWCGSPFLPISRILGISDSDYLYHVIPAAGVDRAKEIVNG